MESRHDEKLSPVARAGRQLASFREHWVHELHRRTEVIRQNVEFLTAKQVPHDRRNVSKPAGTLERHGISPDTPTPSLPLGDQVASATASGELRACAPDHLKSQLLQLLSYPLSFSNEEKEKLLQELAVFLASSSSSNGKVQDDVQLRNSPLLTSGAGDARYPEEGQRPRLVASSKARLGDFPSLFTTMPLLEGTSSRDVELPVHTDPAAQSSFEVGMFSEHSILQLEDEVKLGKRRDQVTGELGAVSGPLPAPEAAELTCPMSPSAAPSVPRPLVQLETVRRFVRSTGKFLALIRRFGLPESSLENKLPWHKPRPAFLARGLQWPPTDFASEQERIEFNRRARRRRKYLMGCPPTWSVMVFNLAFMALLTYNPRANLR